MFKKTFFITCLFSLLVSAISFASNNVTVFIYHRFGDDRLPTTNVSVEAFTQQMNYLKTHDYNVIALSELVRMISLGTSLPPKTAVITIDDAYQSVYKNGWPVLQQYGFPFTIFVYTKGVDDGYGDYMTWTQLRELKAAGVDIQDHGYGHEHLGWKPSGLTDLEYKSWIREDIVKSKRIMTRELGEKPSFFALPYGVYNDVVLAELKKQEYEVVLTQDPGAVSANTDLFMIPRQPILGNEWATLKYFVKSLNFTDLPLYDYQPAPAILDKAMVATIQATLKNPDDYIDGTFGMWLSGLGWHQATLTGDTLSVQLNKALTRASTRVVVSGREKKSRKLATRTWVLIHPDSAKGDQ